MTSRSIDKVMDCLQNELDFEMVMYFVIYKELSLSRLEELILHKSRPTIYRHIQNLLEAELIIETREEKVRSHIKAKYYQLAPNALSMLPRITPEKLAKMSIKEKRQLYEEIRETLFPSIKFIQQSLERLADYLRLLRPGNNDELFTTFDNQDFHLNINFFSDNQYELFLVEFSKFMRSFLQKFVAEEQNNHDAKKSYLFTMSLLPIRKMFDRIMKEKENIQD